MCQEISGVLNNEEKKQIFLFEIFGLITHTKTKIGFWFVDQKKRMKRLWDICLFGAYPLHNIGHYEL